MNKNQDNQQINIIKNQDDKNQNNQQISMSKNQDIQKINECSIISTQTTKFKKEIPDLNESIFLKQFNNKFSIIIMMIPRNEELKLLEENEKKQCVNKWLSFKYNIEKTKKSNIVIPSSVTLIEEGAFKNCSILEQISIHSGPIQIGNDAFPPNAKKITI